MFTGIVEATAKVTELRCNRDGGELVISWEVEAPEIGESIAVNGCCLTVTGGSNGEISFDLLQETLDRTNLRALAAGSVVNLERPMRADGRLGGHFVQGHIDCACAVKSMEAAGADHRLDIELPREFFRYVAEKGSIAINGVSLTVAELGAQSFTVWVIPHTFTSTNLRLLCAGDLVNVEFDILAKYVEQLIGAAT